MEYLSAAASNAATIENEALQAGRRGGGAAKGELVLAISELANSFRHGWGVKRDPVAAKQVGLTNRLVTFENDEDFADHPSTTKLLPTWGTQVRARTEDIIMPTATRTYKAADAMNEVGWCYLEGFGCKKDKVSRPGFINKSSIQPLRLDLIS